MNDTTSRTLALLCMGASGMASLVASAYVAILSISSSEEYTRRLEVFL